MGRGLFVLIKFTEVFQSLTVLISIYEQLHAYFMHKYTDIHIGQLILEKLKNEGRNVSWLAKQVSRDRSSLHRQLNNQACLSFDLLFRISRALKKDFYRYYSHVLEQQIES